MKLNIKKAIVGSVLALIAQSASISAFAETSDQNASASSETTIANQTASHQIRVKEGIIYRSNQVLHPTEKMNLSPKFDFANFSAGYYDTKNERFTLIPNCTPLQDNDGCILGYVLLSAMNNEGQSTFLTNCRHEPSRGQAQLQLKHTSNHCGCINFAHMIQYPSRQPIIIGKI